MPLVGSIVKSCPADRAVCVVGVSPVAEQQLAHLKISVLVLPTLEQIKMSDLVLPKKESNVSLLQQVPFLQQGEAQCCHSCLPYRHLDHSQAKPEPCNEKDN